jgi:hypothetical protein
MPSRSATTIRIVSVRVRLFHLSGADYDPVPATWQLTAHGSRAAPAADRSARRIVGPQWLEQAYIGAPDLMRVGACAVQAAVAASIRGTVPLPMLIALGDLF